MAGAREAGEQVLIRTEGGRSVSVRERGGEVVEKDQAPSKYCQETPSVRHPSAVRVRLRAPSPFPGAEDASCEVPALVW